MTSAYLLRLGLWAAVLGGSLRIAAAFVPYTPQSPLLEALYAVIDVSLLFGLTAIYLREAKAVGWPGLIAFAISFSGIASIVGPDADVFSIDWYQLGSAVTAIAVAALGATMLWTGRMIAASLCWITTPFVSVLAPPELGFQIAGVSFGVGFVAAGLVTVRQDRSL